MEAPAEFNARQIASVFRRLLRARMAYAIGGLLLDVFACRLRPTTLAPIDDAAAMARADQAGAEAQRLLRWMIRRLAIGSAPAGRLHASAIAAGQDARSIRELALNIFYAESARFVVSIEDERTRRESIRILEDFVEDQAGKIFEQWGNRC